MADPPPPSTDDPDTKAISEWTAADTVRLARAGNTEAARDILREFAVAAALTSEQDWPSQIQWAFVQYIAQGFRDIVEQNVDADRALGLKEPKAGRPPGTQTHNHVALAAAYWLMVRRGLRPEQANEQIRSSTGADRTTVQAAAKDCSNFEDPAKFLDRDLVAIISEQPALSKILPSLPAPLP
jgi:hypothetical protein